MDTSNRPGSISHEGAGVGRTKYQIDENEKTMCSSTLDDELVDRDGRGMVCSI